MSTIVSRLQLDHPSLGATGGAPLHAAIEAIYTKIGDNISTRILVAVNLNNAATATVEHDLLTDFANLRYDLYLYDEITFEITRVTSSTSPSLSQFTIVATPSFLKSKINITNNSGAQRDLALIVYADAINLFEGDIKDVDVTTVAPEDGQALVYEASSGKFKPGASGDSSFKLQSVTTNVAAVKAGSIFLDDGKELYLASDASFNLKSATNTLGVTSPGASTAYYVYLDLAFLPAQTSVGTADRKVYAVTSGTSGMFVVLATRPEVTDLVRYVPLYAIKTDGSSNYVTGNFSNLAFRRHQLPATNISPLVYEDADHSVGTVGSAGGTITYGALAPSDFPNATNAHVYNLNSDTNDSNATPLNLTQNGSPSFNGVGMFGKENLCVFDRTATHLTSANAFFNVTTGSVSFGGWFKCDWDRNATEVLIGKYDTGSNKQYVLYRTAGNQIAIEISADGSGTLASDGGHQTNWKSGEWHHAAAVFDNTNNLFKLYLDGQLVTSLAAASNLFSGTATFRVGAKSSSGTPDLFYGGLMQDIFVTSDALTDAQMNNIYTKRFKSQQIAGGHALATDSFPLASLSGKVSFWNLSANVNDGSVNANNLTNTGTVPFTGLGLFGAADCASFDGSTQDLGSSAAFFNPGTNTPFAFGGWFNMQDWSPASERTLMAVGDSTQSYVAIWAEDATKLRAAVNISAGSSFVFVDVPSANILDGSWHHLAVSFVGKKLSFWVDGLLQGTVDCNLIWTQPGTTTLKIANWLAGAQRWIGRASNLFYAKYWEPTTQDIQKLASAVITPTSTVRTQDQDWKLNFLSEDGQITNEMNDSGLVDKDDTKAWFFLGGGSAARANIRLYDQGLGAATVPVRKYDKQFITTPATTLPHALPSMPTSIVILHNQLADGKYVNIAPDVSPKADGTNIYVDLSSYTIDATHDIRIVASIGVPAIGVSKTFKSVTTTYTASVGERIMTDSSGGAFTITLPASAAFGDEIEIFDATESWVPNNVTLARNGLNINGVAADFLCNVDNGKVRLIYFNAAQGWRIYP